MNESLAYDEVTNGSSRQNNIAKKNESSTFDGSHQNGIHQNGAHQNGTYQNGSHQNGSQNTAAMKNESSTYDSSRKPSLWQRIRQNHTIQKLLRVLQFLSAVISLGLFSARLYKIIRTVRRATASNGAVEGILAAAVAYTLISMILKFILKRGGPKWLRLLWVVFDLAFVGGFIAVAYLTSPGGTRTSGPCHTVRGVRLEPRGTNCNLPWGTFILAILSS